MLEDLDAVPWGKLRHNYGAAGDVPGLLRALFGDPGSAATACGELDNSLYHQGGWICDAATAALPFLVEVANSDGCTVRPDLLRTIGALAETATEAAPEYLDAGWSDAWQQAVPGLEALVGDPDPSVRATAVVALTSGPPGPTTVQVLLQQLRREPLSGLRLDLLLGLGATLSHTENALARQTLEQSMREPAPQERLAALMALATADPACPSSDQEVVLDALTSPDVHHWDATESLGCVAAVFTRATELYEDSPTKRRALVTELHHRNAAHGLRRPVLAQLAAVMHHSRSSVAELVPLLANYLNDDDPDVLRLALHLVAVAGPAAAGHEDMVARLLTHRDPQPGHRFGSIRGLVAWALVRLGDNRGEALVVDGLRAGDRDFPFTSTIAHGPWAIGFFSAPSHGEIVEQLSEPTADIADAVRVGLREANGVRARHGYRRAADALAPQYPGLVSALLPLLGDADVAMVTAETLLKFDAGALPRRRSKLISPALTSALQARLLLRRHGAVDPALDVLPGALGDPRQRVDALHLAAELGERLPHGIREQLRDALQINDYWTSTNAAYALWRAGEPLATCGPFVENALEPLARRQWLPVTLPVLEKLIDMRYASPGIQELVRGLLASDRRVSDAGGWRAYTEDEQFRSAAERLLSVL